MKCRRQNKCNIKTEIFKGGGGDWKKTLWEKEKMLVTRTGLIFMVSTVLGWGFEVPCPRTLS